MAALNQSKASDFTTWRERHSKLEEFRKLVEAGEFDCEHNPTMSSRNPLPNAGDKSRKCKSVATHVETVYRRFVMGTYVYDVPLCDEHSGWHW